MYFNKYYSCIQFVNIKNKYLHTSVIHAIIQLEHSEHIKGDKFCGGNKFISQTKYTYMKKLVT